MVRTLFVVALFAIPGIAAAQGGRGNQGGGQLAQPSTATSLQSLSGSTGTSSGSTGSQSGSSSFGSIGGSSGGSSLFSGSGRLGAGGSNNGLSAQSAEPFQFGQFAQALSNTGFVGGANTNGFVGSRAANQQGSQGASQQAFQGFNRGGNGSDNGRAGGGSRPKLGIRPTLRVGFATPTVTPAVATTRVSTRLGLVVDKRPELAGVTAATDETGRLVLRGTVANDDARQLAAALVRLEPGVGEVVNELTVGTEPTP